MKKRKKSLLLLLSILLGVVMLIGCGSKEKVTADESVKIFYDFVFKGEKSEFEKLGVTQKEVDDILAEQKKVIIDGTRKNFVVGGLLISEDDLQNIYKARCEALKKLTVTTETVKKDGKEATLKVGTTYFKEQELDEKAGNDAVATVKALNLTDQQQLRDKLAKQYINNLISGYKNVKVSTDSKYMECKFVLKDKIWQAEDPSAFGFELSKLTIGLAK